MRISASVALILAALSVSACASSDYGDRRGYGHQNRGHGYDRPGDRRDSHQRRQLGNRDRIYRDRNGHYYCKRSDGTTGALIGALAGGVLGNVIAPGKSKTLGTVLGAGGGALAGRAIDRNNVHCE